MKRLIPAKTAGILLVASFALLSVFHLLLILRVLPADFVWGGGLDSSPQATRMEIISLVITLVFLLISALKTFRRKPGGRLLVNIGMGIIFLYMVLNVMGNLVSESALEKAIFIPLSLIMCLLALRLLFE